MDLVGGEVAHLGGRPEAERAGARVRLHDDGAAQALAQAQDLRLEMSLVLLGDVVLGVLLQVAERARGLDAARHLLAARGLELVEVRLQRLEALGSDRLACHPPDASTLVPWA